MAEKPLMLLGVDESEPSIYALEWTLDHFFPLSLPHPFKLAIIHAKTLPASVVGMADMESGELVSVLEADLKRTAGRTVAKVKDICSNKKVEDVSLEIIEGDPRNVLCDSVDRHRASLLVLGSHGYGLMKRAVLGSVSDYCAHHAHCSVMIVKRPKLKH